MTVEKMRQKKSCEVHTHPQCGFHMGANTENVNTKRTHRSDECVLEHGINTLMFQMLDLHNEDID